MSKESEQSNDQIYFSTLFNEQNPNFEQFLEILGIFDQGTLLCKTDKLSSTTQKHYKAQMGVLFERVYKQRRAF